MSESEPVSEVFGHMLVRAGVRVRSLDFVHVRVRVRVRSPKKFCVRVRVCVRVRSSLHLRTTITSLNNDTCCMWHASFLVLQLDFFVDRFIHIIGKTLVNFFDGGENQNIQYKRALMNCGNHHMFQNVTLIYHIFNYKVYDRNKSERIWNFFLWLW